MTSQGPTKRDKLLALAASERELGHPEAATNIEALAAALPEADDVFVSLPPIDAGALFGGRRVVCLDVETDARYSDLGVGRLVCMAYSFDGVHVQIVDAATAVQLFRDWICDDELVLFGQSIYSDLAVLAQASYRTATGVDCVPGTEWAYELVHRAYERGRVVDTEIRTRLTCIRFGPHKSNPGLGPTVKYLFGVDIADAKSLTGNTKRAVLKLLADATPWSEWPRDIFDATPWRYKYGALARTPLAQGTNSLPPNHGRKTGQHPPH